MHADTSSTLVFAPSARVLRPQMARPASGTCRALPFRLCGHQVRERTGTLSPGLHQPPTNLHIDSRLKLGDDLHCCYCFLPSSMLGSGYNKGYCCECGRVAGRRTRHEKISWENYCILSAIVRCRTANSPTGHAIGATIISKTPGSAARTTLFHSWEPCP